MQFQLQSDHQFQPYFNLLHLFAYGTYQEYLSAKMSLPELSPAQQQKLRHLTIVTLSESSKVLHFSHYISIGLSLLDCF